MAAKSNLLNMALCLTSVCLVCSALLGGMYALTAEPIAKTNADILRASVNAVLPEGGELSEAVPVEVGGQASEYYIKNDASADKVCYQTAYEKARDSSRSEHRQDAQGFSYSYLHRAEGYRCKNQCENHVEGSYNSSLSDPQNSWISVFH